ncbi:MAG TPA: glycosyltransferase family 2 protein [Chthonomonadaceae bacterium]|nr:glycosyltransferase family 2 protein [Chthonomonadaceae bacterium]
MLSFAIVFWVAWGLIAYTYVLFPILLAGIVSQLGRRSGAQEPEAETTAPELPRVAMVVAAYNEAKVIAAKLSNTWSIDYPAERFQIYIGSDGSSDGTNEILSQCDDKRLHASLFTERRGKISVLNDLMRKVDADIVVMSDANTMFAPDAVRKLVAHFRDPKIGCVSGELSLEQEGGVSGEGLYWKYENWIKRNESRLGFLIGCNGGIFALRPKLYEPLPASTIVEDFVLSMRILERGYKVIIEPAAHATEPACATAKAEMVRKIRIGAGNWQALGLNRAVLHPRFGLRSFAFWGHKVLRWMVPLFFLISLGACIALLGQTFYRVALALMVAGALLAVCASYPAIGSRLPRITRPISYFYLMNYALLRGFFRFLFGTQRVTWDKDQGKTPQVS